MPINLKRLLAHPAGSARSKSPSMLRYYQRTLLVGGGVALSIFILVAAALISWVEVSDYISTRHSTFLIHKSLLAASIGTKQVSFQRGITSSEYIWRARRRAPLPLLRQFEAQGGRVVVQRDSYTASQLAVGSITADRAASAFTKYLAFTEENGYPADTHVLPGGVPLSGYLYNPERTFISILPSPRNVDAPALAGARDAADLIRRLVADVGDPQQLANNAGRSSTRTVTWLPPRPDPITGEPVVRLVQTALDGDKPFMVVVSNFPVKALSDSLAGMPYEGAFAIFDRAGKTVLIQQGRSADDADLATRLVDSRAGRGEVEMSAEEYHQGLFIVSDRLPDTGWTLTYAYSWRTILAALAPRLTLLVIATLVGLLGLWTFVIVFNARVLKPIYLRSLRVAESEMLNRTIIQTAPVGLSLLSATDGGVLLQNEVMRAYETSANSTSFHESLWKTYRSVVEAAGSRSDELVEHELTVDRQDREQTHLHFTAIRARYQGIDVLLCALLDITARKNIELKLEEARHAADAANSAKSTFLATMSHEIRTPLNAILGNLELLAHSQLSGVQARRLRTIDSASAALLDIINNVLDLSKVESNQMAVESVPFDLGRLLREIVSVFAPLAEAKNVSLRCELDDGLALVCRGDVARLRQIMSNLVSNGIKFTERGAVMIHASEARDVVGNAMVELRVSDTGIGISEEGLTNIFDVYAQADASIHRRFGGTGLGLHLCHRLVTLMDGSITVKSRLGVGSVFAVRLSLPAEPDAFPAQGKEELVDAAARPDQTDPVPIRVLVAEDHPASRELLRDQLELLGYEADIVENGSEALRAFGERPYDVVLTDLGMPVLDGYALAVCIRDQRKSVPVIAMTANTTADEHRRCFDAGIVEVVVKPLSLAALDRTLRRSAGRAERASVDVAESASRRNLSDGVRMALRSSTLESLAEIGIAAPAGDLNTVATHMHSIKGGFAMVGEISIVAQCEQLEQLLRAEGLASMELLWPELERHIRDALMKSSLRANTDNV